MKVATKTVISLELDCCPDAEQSFGSLLAQLSDRKRGAWAALEMGDWDEHLAAHRTLRRRAQHARILGYAFREIDRSDHHVDIYAINTSAPERQGRRMAPAYWKTVTFPPEPEWGCSRHAVRPYGVLRGDELVAYLWCYRVGGLALFSSILGHADHLQNDVMYLLAVEALREQWPLGGWAVYGEWLSGTDGLRFFKERIGMGPVAVEWRR